MGVIGGEAPAGGRGGTGEGLLWASLVPLFLLLHPYGGIVQDARIYLGRGVADRDPAGVGQDFMFSHDGQTGFSLMRGAIDGALHVAGPGTVSLVLALLGGLLWLAGAAALFRGLVVRRERTPLRFARVGAPTAKRGAGSEPSESGPSGCVGSRARGRVAWAAVVCALALPASYGAWGVFRYAEVMATPRSFAQAAVLGGLAALVGGRRVLGAGLLATAAAFHPLVALPGFAVAGLTEIRVGRRPLLVLGAAGAGLAAAAALGLPPLDRLIRPMDPDWLAILRGRSAYLFPSLWPAACFGPVVGQAATVAVAAATAPPRVRTFLLAVLAVGLGGLALSWLLGDRFAATLVVQVQPWRALWLLAVVGNAAVALAAAALWRRGAGGRLVLAALVLTRLSEGDPVVAGALAVLTIVLLLAEARGAMPRVSRLALGCAGIAALALCIEKVVGAGAAEMTLLRSARAEGGQVDWSMIVGLDAQAVPLAAGATALALLGRWRPGRVARLAGSAAVLCGLAAAAWAWDARPADRREAERAAGDAALGAALGSSPGEVLWVDEDSQNWFLLGRPAFLNGAQAGPMLYSRELALEWAARASLLLRLGLARPEDAAPWARLARSPEDLALTAEGVRRFCADGRRPAAVVAPGDQRGGAPAGLASALWRPPVPVRRLVVGDAAVHWRVTDLYTVMRCPEGAPTADPPGGSARSRDARSLG